MTLPASGAIRLATDINTELSLSATAQNSMGTAAVRALAGVASGPIRLGADFWSKSSAFNFAYFAGGQITSSTYTHNTDKYNFSTAAITAGTQILTTAFNITKGTTSSSAISNKTNAIIIRSGTSESAKYTFATDAVSVGGTIAGQGIGYVVGDGCYTMGNSLVGYFLGGNYSGVGDFHAAMKYVYATDASTIACALCLVVNGNQSRDRAFGTGIGNTTQGICIDGLAAGLPPNGRAFKYTYATETSAATAVALTAGVSVGSTASASSPTFGLRWGGVSSSAAVAAIKYTFSTDTAATGASYSGSPRSDISGAGNSLVAVFVGGFYYSGSSYAYYATSDLYTFSNDSVTTTTSLPTAKRGAAAYSGNPAWA